MTIIELVRKVQQLGAGKFDRGMGPNTRAQFPGQFVVVGFAPPGVGLAPEAAFLMTPPPGFAGDFVLYQCRSEGGRLTPVAQQPLTVEQAGKMVPPAFIVVELEKLVGFLDGSSKWEEDDPCLRN